jgi:DNA-binding transcriptional LysR family regulator
VKLEAFNTLVAVLRHGSFAAASEFVHLTPSAVSLQIKQLEEYFGQPLFDRSARKVRPTAFAEELAARSRSALGEIEALRRNFEGSVSGRIRLGTIESVQMELLPGTFSALRAVAPALMLHFVRGSTASLLDDLKAGRIDAAVVVRPPSGGSSRLSWTPLRQETFVMVVPSGARGSKPQDFLQAYDWIRLDRSLSAGRVAARYVEQLVPGVRRSIELPGIEGIVAMVSAGLGVSVVPRLRSELLRGYDVRQVSLGTSRLSREIALVCRSADAEDRRQLAIRDAFVLALERRDEADGGSPAVRRTGKDREPVVAAS